MKTIDEAIALFGKRSKVEHEEVTTYTYLQYLKKFKVFVDEILQKKYIDEITLEDCYDFGGWLKHQNYKPSTQSYHMTALKRLIMICKAHDYVTIDADDIPIPSYDCEHHEAMDVADYKKMIQAIQSKPESFKTLRDEMIIRLLFHTGVRVSELCRMKMDDLILADRYVKVKTSKNKNKYRIAGCWDEETEVRLLQYIDERKDFAKCDSVIVGFDRNPKNVGQAVTTRTIQRIFRGYREIANLSKKLVPHSERHGWAGERMKQNMHPRYIQNGLGHVVMNTIQIYTDIQDQDMIQNLKNHAVVVDTA